MGDFSSPEVAELEIRLSWLLMSPFLPATLWGPETVPSGKDLEISLSRRSSINHAYRDSMCPATRALRNKIYTDVRVLEEHVSPHWKRQPQKPAIKGMCGVRCSVVVQASDVVISRRIWEKMFSGGAGLELSGRVHRTCSIYSFTCLLTHSLIHSKHINWDTVLVRRLPQ